MPTKKSPPHSSLPVPVLLIERRIYLIRGHKATLEFNSTGFTITPQKEFEKDVEPIVHQKSGGEVLDLHHRNLFNAIRKNEAIKCDVMLGYYGVVACEMSVASYRMRKYLKWDAARERMVKA